MRAIKNEPSRRSFVAIGPAAGLALAMQALPAKSQDDRLRTDDRLQTNDRLRTNDLEARVDHAIDRTIADRRIVGTVVIVVRDGDVAYRRAAGYADREAGRPMHEDAIFRLASLSKTIVSATALALVDRGRLGLDDPVTKWLPGFQPRTKDGAVPVISIRQLLTHTAGLSYGFYEPPDGSYHRAGVSDGLDQSGLDLDEELHRIALAGLAAEPGTTWRYSIATDVLGGVIAEAAGESLPDSVQRLVTAPLAMVDSGFSVSESGRLAVPYADGKPEPVRMADPQLVPFRGLGVIRFSPSRAFDRASFPSGGAGMIGTAGDFVRFLEAVRTGGQSILTPSAVQQMTTNQIGNLTVSNLPGWGFGFGCTSLKDQVAAKSPQAPGTWAFTSAYGHSFFVDPERNLTVVAFTNTALEGGFGAFVPAIRDAVYGRTQE
ncbi:CubicO group peptidase, beta-lactamase class C family [Rhizobiales bacterium GAS188]|nr:CubicO group peptidase, beta-lactamase class C family [Rhizobiales bacterium GAS188]